MAGGSVFEIQGLTEALKRVNALTNSLEPQQVETVLLAGANIVRAEAARRAPVGPGKGSYKGGRLKRSLKAKRGKRRGKDVAIAFAAVDRKIAPHAHFVEFGTSKAPAHPFFRPAIDTTKDEVGATVSAGLKALVEGAVK